METNDILLQKLVSWDEAFLAMIDSLTGKTTIPGYESEEIYFVAVDYEKINDPEVLCAVMDAIAGRLGERLVSIGDVPEMKRLIVRVKFSKDEEPKASRFILKRSHASEHGGFYRDKENGEVVNAMQFDRNRASDIVRYVGNGEIYDNKDRPWELYFLNTAGKVWQHAVEWQYLVWIAEEHFAVVDKEQFEAAYEPV